LANEVESTHVFYHFIRTKVQFLAIAPYPFMKMLFLYGVFVKGISTSTPDTSPLRVKKSKQTIAIGSV